jgi:hypothetical protein
MNLVDKIAKALSSHEDFEEVMRIIRKNAYGHPYLVGGKIYRTVSEIIHGIDVGARQADWDALVMGDVVPNYLPKGWSVIPPRFTNSKKNSVELQKLSRKGGNLVRFGGYNNTGMFQPMRKLHKIDIIGIKDVPGDDSLRSYFNVVPLDVQKIAFNFETKTLYGVDAINAIKKRHIKVNNPEGCLPGLDLAPYIARKAGSLGYTYEGQVISKTKCNCYDGDTQALWNNGCKLPQFHC